jgi:hypothetical protein
VLVADVDGDGDLDLLLAVASYYEDPVQLYLNDGRGAFHRVQDHLPPEMTSSTVFTVGDVDGDGDQDLVWRWMVTTEAAGTGLLMTEASNRVDLNDGKGHFERASVQLPNEQDYVFVLALADIDGDGDLDLLVGNDISQDRVITNVTHQLAWRAVPRIGYPLTMDLRGPANSPWALYVQRGDEVHGANPRLHEPDELIAMGSLDTNGEASYAIAIPNDPLLVGSTWCWRAFIGGVRSNLEITTFTDL